MKRSTSTAPGTTVTRAAGAPDGAEPLRDALADRDQRVGPPEEPAGRRPGVRRPAMVHGADQPRPRAAARQGRQPVVVGLVGVDQVDLELPERAPDPPDLGGEPPWPRGPLEREPLHQRDPGRANVRLEHVAADAGEPHRVAALLEGPREVQRRIRAAGPPAVRDDVQDPERPHRRPAERGHDRRLHLGDLDRPEAPVVDRALPEKAGAAGRLMPERLLAGAERRGQPRVGGAEEGHRRHPDRCGHMGGSAVRADERIQLRDEGGQQGRAITAHEAPDGLRGRRLDRVGKPTRLGPAEQDRVNAPSREPRRERGDARGGPELRGTERRPQLEPDPRGAERHPHLSQQPSRLNPARGVDPQRGRGRGSLHAERREEPEVARHLVDPIGLAPEAHASAGRPAPPRSPRASALRSAIRRARSRTSSAGSGRGRTRLPETAGLDEPGGHASGRDEAPRDARLGLEDGPTQGPRHQSSAPGRAPRSARRVGSAMTVSPSQFGRRTRARWISRRGSRGPHGRASARALPPAASTRARSSARHSDRADGLRAARAGRAAPTSAGAPRRPVRRRREIAWFPTSPAVSGAPRPSPSSPGGSRPRPGPAGPRRRDRAAPYAW